jgi:hypothetical protein
VAALGATMLAATITWASPPIPGRVVLLDPGASSATGQRWLTRIREELAAGGFEVSSVDPGPLRDPISIVRAMDRQDGAVATIALVGDPDGPGAELWILDRIGTSPEVRRIPATNDDREHLAEVLAIRTIEVLRASALKLLLDSARPPPAPPAPVVPVAAPATIPRARPFGLEAGVSIVESIRGPGPAAIPVVRARLWFGDSLFGRITLAGLGSRPRVESSIGSASVAQSFGLGELGIAFRPGRRWRPVLGLAGGALYVQTDGAGLSPSYQGQRPSGWAAVVDAGTGVLANLGSGLSLALEVHGLVALPHPTVRFAGMEVATLGYPTLLASLTMVAWP